MQKDYYEPITPQPLNRSGEISSGSTGTTNPSTTTGEQQGGITEQAGQVATKAQEKAGEVAAIGKEKAGELGHKAQEGADVGLDKAADGMQRAADQMRDRLATGDGVQAQVGTKVADTMERTAGYLREHDTTELWGDVETFVREHPMQAAVGALAAGFVLGRIVR